MTAAPSATLATRAHPGDARSRSSEVHREALAALPAVEHACDATRTSPPRSSPLEHDRVRLRFARFALIGVANTGVTFAVFNLCTALLHAPAAWANVIGWIAGFANSFVWNRTWTFGDRRHLRVRRVLPRFALASLLALGVSEGVLIGLHAALLSWGAARLGSQTVLLNGIELVAIGCSLCMSYALSAGWAFRKS